ncbi:MAG: Asp-tRNA(Asn)/Glu-tRNA(Gln) amidotransferase subunit GatB, partial [Halobacteriovoraceae bacterium]|nr:Asp-tRNA(Asn)/Glu-tRNA(Gln) amidotransferase subunit GatB [Halobacteriovoraceae bacterium]
EVLRHATLLALATHSKINLCSRFDRKNYFYPDLPKGYQISQYHLPFAEDGYMLIEGESGEKEVRLERIQIEEDTGKAVHEGEISLIDLNRAGTPLLEIVGRPDLHNAAEASAYLKNLHTLLVYLEISRGNLQEGNFRADVNISLRPEGSDVLNTRTEIKNLNSFRSVERAIQKEIERQTQILKQNKKIQQETLKFDAIKETLMPLRSKGDAHDYRYFPEPDLLILEIKEKEIEQIKTEIPELPLQKKKRFEKEYCIPGYDARVLISDKDLADYFEETVKAYGGEAKKVSNWIMVEFLRLLNEAGLSVKRSPVPPRETALLLESVQQGAISGKMAKDVYEKMFDQGKGAREIIDKAGLSQIDDNEYLLNLAGEIVNSHPEEVGKYLAGRTRLLGFFVGQLMKKTKGQANPQMANKIIKELLEKKR